MQATFVLFLSSASFQGVKEVQLGVEKFNSIRTDTAITASQHPSRISCDFERVGVIL
jgi:hypothetical protein